MPQAGEDVAPGLKFSFVPRVIELKEAGPVIVDWELLNAGQVPIYVCQWPGPAFGGSWKVTDTKSEAFIPGYPHSHELERKYFIELKPGEAILGSDSVTLFGTVAGEVWLRGEYRSDQEGEQHGLKAWRGRVYSESVRITVPRVPPKND